MEASHPLCHNPDESDTKPVFVGEQGRIVIPAVIREKYGWDAGTDLCVVETTGSIELVPREALLDRLEGCMKGAFTVEEFIEERRAEAARELDE